MKQIVKVFKRYYLADTPAETQCNNFLNKNPNYTIDKISYSKEPGKCTEQLCVVFNINNEQKGNI